MSRFRDDFALAFEDVAFEQGESLAYTPVGGSARTITAPIWRAVETLRDESNHEVQATIAKCFAKKHATEGVLTPTRGDKIVWDGMAWDFAQTKGDQGDVWELWFVNFDIQAFGHQRGGQM
jgi:hypothetical protein